jgi:hypothetical protein
VCYHYTTEPDRGTPECVPAVGNFGDVENAWEFEDLSVVPVDASGPVPNEDSTKASKLNFMALVMVNLLELMQMKLMLQISNSKTHRLRVNSTEGFMKNFTGMNVMNEGNFQNSCWAKYFIVEILTQVGRPFLQS